MNTYFYKNNKKQAGLSLVELLIAAMLGVFVISGLGAVYISSKQSYLLREQTSELDENARTAIRALREHLEHAGYSSTVGQRVYPYILPTTASIPSTTSCTSSETSIINPSVLKITANGGVASPDQIAVTYVADQSLNTDCTGGALPDACMPPAMEKRQAQMIYSSFYLTSSSAQKNSLGTSLPSLQCAGSRNATAQPIAQGIENMKILYGVDLTVPAANERRLWDVDAYLTAAQVTSANAWDKVAAIQVALLVRSIEPAFPQAQSAKYDLIGTVINTNDRYRRAVYSTTIYLRNIAR